MPRRDDTPTELEHCVLGVVWRRGPCTSYAVRAEFAASVTAQWSASAGSIYPAIRRLTALALLEARRTAWGRRGKHELSLTAIGAETLRRWIGAIDAAAAGPTPDPVRTRFLFLDALNDAHARRAAIAQAQSETRDRLAVVRAAARDERLPPGERLAMRGAELQLEARLRWLDEAAQRVDEDSASS